MKVFEKKETLIRSICFMAFFVAINVICSFVAVYVPILSIFLVIFLPLTSSIVEINCKDRWFPIYALATIGLSIAVSLSQIEFTIFYIVPSIFTGYIFGIISKKKLPDLLAILFASLVQVVLSTISIVLLNAIFDVNLIDVFAKILKISNRFLFNTALLLIIFIVSLIQTFLSFIVVDSELQKLGVKSKDEIDHSALCSFCSSALSLLSFPFSFIYLPVSYLLFGISLYFAGFIIYYQFKNCQKHFLLIDLGVILITIFVYAFINNFFSNGKDLIIFSLTPFLISVCSILHYFLKKSKQ